MAPKPTTTDRTPTRPRKGTLRVEDPAAIAFLLDHDERRVLEPFLGNALPLSEAARALGIRLNALHYRARRLLDWGLLRDAGSVVRKGRELRVYRAAADTFAIPLDTPSGETLATLVTGISSELAARVGVGLAQALKNEGGRWEIVVRAGEDGVADLLLEPRETVGETPLEARLLADEGPALLWQDAVLELAPERAKALQRDLAELLGRYLELSDDSGQPHLLRLGVVPLGDDPADASAG